MINNLLNFKKAYSSANELLCSSEAIDTFPFLPQMTEKKIRKPVFTFSLTIIALKEYTIIPKEHSKNMLNINFCSLRIFLHTQI